ncbi:hypothetical protein EVAR_36120_1 [Eumeta japonica]|uniref:Uncharacterized protein n=1 Tax=Eumeta variegata TaxID=151549 RepID=A0A4C1X145_EUMVA|nr:hypothetical protein EVAR_36120_1 [Eumeta japonica]
MSRGRSSQHEPRRQQVAGARRPQEARNSFALLIPIAITGGADSARHCLGIIETRLTSARADVTCRGAQRARAPSTHITTQPEASEKVAMKGDVNDNDTATSVVRRPPPPADARAGRIPRANGKRLLIYHQSRY